MALMKKKTPWFVVRHVCWFWAAVETFGAGEQYLH